MKFGVKCMDKHNENPAIFAQSLRLCANIAGFSYDRFCSFFNGLKPVAINISFLRNFNVYNCLQEKTLNQVDAYAICRNHSEIASHALA
jgi:hypothetical protein